MHHIQHHLETPQEIIHAGIIETGALNLCMYFTSISRCMCNSVHADTLLFFCYINFLSTYNCIFLV